MTSRIEFRDRALANLCDKLSGVAQFTPGLAGMVGHRNSPPQLAARWRNAGIASADIESWQIFQGASESGKLPKNYGRIALIGIEKRVLDGLQERYGGQQAVVYALGSATMIGTVEDKPRFMGDFPGEPDRYAVGMRVGSGVLRAAIAVRGDDGGAVVPFDGMSRGGDFTRADWPDLVPFI